MLAYRKRCRLLSTRRKGTHLVAFVRGTTDAFVLRGGKRAFGVIRTLPDGQVLVDDICALCATAATNARSAVRLGHRWALVSSVRECRRAAGAFAGGGIADGEIG